MPSGREQLRDWMDRRSFNQTETAKYIGMDLTYICQLVNGVRTPGLLNALIIERRTGIPVEAWTANALSETDLVEAGPSRKRKSGKA